MSQDLPTDILDLNAFRAAKICAKIERSSHNHDGGTEESGDGSGPESEADGDGMTDEEFWDALEFVVNDMKRELNEIYQLAASGHLDNALSRIHKMITPIDYLPGDMAEPDVWHMASDSELDPYLFTRLLGEKLQGRKIDFMPFPYDAIFQLWGMLLLDTGKRRLALAKLKMAHKWNPTNAGIYGDLIAACVQNGDEKSWLQAIKDEYAVAREGADLVDVFYHAGMYCMMHHQIGKAMVFFDFIKDREEFKSDILERYGDDILDDIDCFKKRRRPAVKKTFAEFGFVPGPSPHVTAVLTELAEKAGEMGETGFEQELYDELYGLTRLEKYRKLREKAKKK